jgi:hypothetical protein
MNIEILKEFFGWMTVINVGMYTFTAIACISMKGFLNRISGKMFGVSEETGKAIVYGYIGMYKLLFIVFNLAPWLALTIMVK